jgi:hypothetical protein
VSVGQVVVNIGADVWLPWAQASGSTGCLVGVATTPAMPGNPLHVECNGRIPYAVFNIGSGTSTTVVASTTPGRGASGTVIGTCDSSGELFVRPSYIGIGGTPQAFGGDLAGSTSFAQWLASISGPGGVAGPVPLEPGVSITGTSGQSAAVNLSAASDGLVEAGPSGFVGPALDRANAGTLTLGAANATLVKSIQNFQAPAVATLSLDTPSAGTLAIGPTQAATVNLGSNGAVQLTFGTGGSQFSGGVGATTGQAFTWNAASIAITTGTTVLSTTQYNCPVIVLTGSLSGNCILQFPNTRAYWVVDGSALTLNAHTVTAECATATKTVSISTAVYVVYCNGSNKMYLAALA